MSQKLGKKHPIIRQESRGFSGKIKLMLETDFVGAVLTKKS